MLSKTRVVLSLLACLVVPSAAQATVISLSGGLTNNSGVNQNFEFSVSLPLPPDFYGFASTEGSFTVTPGQSGTGSATPGTQPFYLSGTAFDGVSTVDLGVGNGTAPCVAVRVAETCTLPLLTNSFAPTFFNLATVRFSIEVTPDTTVSFSGNLTIEPAQAPEPSALLLLATAAAGAWRARRRKG